MYGTLVLFLAYGLRRGCAGVRSAHVKWRTPILTVGGRFTSNARAFSGDRRELIEGRPKAEDSPH